METVKRKPPQSWCRHCGGFGPLTEEHLPPKATGNNTVINRIDTGEIDTHHELLDLRTSWTEGHTVLTLCDSCNGKGSRWKYVQEYTKWHNHVVTHMRNLVARTPNYDPFALGKHHTIRLPLDVMPRRFTGQAVAMLLATQATHHLWAEHPQLVRLVGGDRELMDDAPGPVDITPCRVFLGLANENMTAQRNDAVAITFGDPNPKSSAGLHLPPRGSSNTAFQFFVYSPFVVTMMLGDSTPPWRDYTEITHWAQMDHHDRLAKSDRQIDVPAVKVGMLGLLGSPETARGHHG